MKKYLFIIITLITSLVATSCQEEDFGFTKEEIFRGAYGRNFEKTYGKIDPNQSWDFSSFSMTANTKTRAAESWGAQFYTDINLNKYLNNGFSKKSFDNNATSEFYFQLEQDIEIMPAKFNHAFLGYTWSVSVMDENNNQIGSSYKYNDDIKNTDKKIANIIHVDSDNHKLVYFKLQTEGGLAHTNYSLKNEAKIQLLGTENGAYVYLLGIEDSQGVIYGNDCDDAFFFIISQTPLNIKNYSEPAVYKEGKTYLMEDFGSSTKFDFNDIVVDVYAKKTYQVNNNRNGFNNPSVSTKAQIIEVSGVLPFTLTIDGHIIAQRKELQDEPNADYSVFSNEITLSSWNPNQNNIQLSVNPSLKYKENFISQFPGPGQIPYIIAVPLGDRPNGEEVNFDFNKRYESIQ